MCDGPITPAMLQNLQSLSIDWCKLQGSLFTYDAAQYLSQLHCLVLEDCPFLNRIVEASNKRIILPKLKQLSLTHLPLLYYDTATFDIECPSLEDLYVQDYPNIPDSSSDFHSSKQEQFRRIFKVKTLRSATSRKSLFTYDVAECLSQLTCFALHECHFLKRIVEASNKKIILPKLEQLSLSILPILSYESATSDMECPSLEDLCLFRCPRSSSDFHSRKQVQLRRF